MKTNSLVTLAIVILLTSFTISCSQGPIITGSKNYVSQKVKVEKFNAISLSGSANITYWQDSLTHVEIHGSDNIIPLIETEVSEGTLNIKFKKNIIITNMGKLEIKVYSPNLNKLRINGSGNIVFMNGISTDQDIELGINGSGNIAGEKFNCQAISMSIHGSGDIKLQQIHSERCSASIAGSGDITVSGKTSIAAYSIAGSGNISAAELEATDAEASIAGSGSISCFTNGRLSGSVKGSGDVSYKGNPHTIDFPHKHLHKLN